MNFLLLLEKVDRFTMTRELSNLKKEGFIEQTGNVIKLLMN
jgi:hypothetical protein